MPQELDEPYNAALEEAFGSLRSQLEGLLQDLEELTVRFVAAVAEGDGYDDTERRLEQGAQELKEAAASAVERAQDQGRGRMERAHARGYEAAASAAGVAASELPDWSPSSSVDPYERAPFDGTARGFVQGAIDEEISYTRQDLKYIRKYVDEDEYARAVANVLAQGDEGIKAALRDRGIDVDDLDLDALEDRAADVLQNTKTRGSSRVRGILKELEPDEIARRDPALWNRIKRNGTDSVPRVLDEVAKDLAADSPALELVSWELSSRHSGLESSPDACDVLARQDLYGFGAGKYHPKTTPSHPHTNCECSIAVVTADPSDWGRIDNERPDAFDVQEQELRSALEDLPGDRTITEAYVARVKREIDTVIGEVHSNPRA